LIREAHVRQKGWGKVYKKTLTDYLITRSKISNKLSPKSFISKKDRSKYFPQNRMLRKRYNSK
jgi:hypothetical protein